MTKMPDAIAYMRAGGQIKAGCLLFFDFLNQPMFTWTGFGNLTTKDGQLWQGLGNVVSFESITQVAGSVAKSLTVKLSHDQTILTDAVINEVVNSQTLVKGRRFFLALQFFGDDWQPVDSYQVKYVGVMDKMSVNFKSDLREISLTIEQPLVRRRTPRAGNFDDTDQKSIFPNDRFFEFISSLKNKTTQWPKY